MANGKVVKYKKVYKIVIEGSADMTDPTQEPSGLRTAREPLEAIVASLNWQYATRTVSMKEVKR